MSRPRGHGGPLTREELFGGWRLFFERLAAVDPVVLVIEDAQYADTGLLDFLDHLIDWARDLPIYVLVFARTELHQARPGFGVGRNRSTLTLDPLDRASMDRLVDALVPGMPLAARAKITDQAQGVPLFAVETVRALIDRDVVQPCRWCVPPGRGTSATWPCRTACTRCWPPGSTPWTPAPGGWSPTPPCWAPPSPPRR